MSKIGVISGKEALVSTEQSKNSFAIADFELQKFGSRVRQNGASTDYADALKNLRNLRIDIQ